MRCIFCKCDSLSSKSREHIIPESLGNIAHVLPPGVVCDKCNNYLSREVEKPLLESPYFRDLRFKMAVPSKKKRVPKIRGIHLQSLTELELARLSSNGSIGIYAAQEGKELAWRQLIRQQKGGTLIFPIAHAPDDYITSRFIAKVGLEVLASRIVLGEGELDEIVEKPELDELRHYVRHGTPGRVWPYAYREIYPSDFIFNDLQESFEVLHEYDILVTDNSEYYIVVAIFGVEYVLNLGGREIDGYYKWLHQHEGQSLLYIDKNV